MSAAPTKVNVFNPTGPKKKGPSFQSEMSSKPECPKGQAPSLSGFVRVQNPDGTWTRTGEWTCLSSSPSESLYRDIA